MIEKNNKEKYNENRIEILNAIQKQNEIDKKMGHKVFHNNVYQNHEVALFLGGTWRGLVRGEVDCINDEDETCDVKTNSNGHFIIDKVRTKHGYEIALKKYVEPSTRINLIVVYNKQTNKMDSIEITESRAQFLKDKIISMYHNNTSKFDGIKIIIKEFKEK